MTDEEIVEVVINSDRERYSELVARYEGKLHRYARYILGNEADAKDIVQETFIKAFVNLKSFNTAKKFSSWIYRIAHNEAINRLKKNKKMVLSLDLDFFDSLLSGVSSSVGGDPNDPLEEYEKDELKREVGNGLSKLSLKYREVITLYYLQDKSYEEISDILRVPLGTVGTRMNRGKKLLKELYRNYD